MSRPVSREFLPSMGGPSLLGWRPFATNGARFATNGTKGIATAGAIGRYERGAPGAFGRYIGLRPSLLGPSLKGPRRRSASAEPRSLGLGHPTSHFRLHVPRERLCTAPLSSCLGGCLGYQNPNITKTHLGAGNHSNNN